MSRNPDETRPEHLQRMMARALPGLYEEIKSTVYFLLHLPESIRPQGVERAAALQARAEFIRKLMEDDNGRRTERRVPIEQQAGEGSIRGRDASGDGRKVRSYGEYEYPERTESPFEEVTRGPRRGDGGGGD